MLTHAAARLSDALDDLEVEHRDLLDRAPRALWLKTLLVHGASRGHLEEWVAPIVTEPDTKQRWRQRNKHLDRYVGHGQVDPERALECTEQRVTVLGAGTLRDDQAHEYEFPLPPSLLGVGRFTRRLVITLSWFCPPWPTSARYRSAVLTLDSTKTAGLNMNQGSERGDPRHHGAGTVVHIVKHGRGAVKYARDGVIALKVNCRGDASKPLDGEIPYTLAATLEVDESIGIDIYQEIKNRLRITAGVRVAVSR